MHPRFILVAFFVVFFFVSGTDVLSAGKTFQKVGSEKLISMPFGGREREYLIHFPPSYDGTKPFPLVIALHGGIGSIRQLEVRGRLSKKADLENFIAVYPAGTSRSQLNMFLFWNGGDCCGFPMAKHIDDAGFIGAVIDKLEADLSIDPKRVYLTGLSNGGSLAYLVACRFSDKVAAIAPVGASMSGHECEPKHPVSVVVIHGTGDKHVPYDGGIGRYGHVGFPVNKESVSYAVSYWAQHDGCSAVKTEEINPHITRESHTGGKQGSAVVLYTLKDARHGWPGGNCKSVWFGKNKNINPIIATDVIWQFFKDHPKP